PKKMKRWSMHWSRRGIPPRLVIAIRAIRYGDACQEQSDRTLEISGLPTLCPQQRAASQPGVLKGGMADSRHAPALMPWFVSVLWAAMKKIRAAKRVRLLFACSTDCPDDGVNARSGQCSLRTASLPLLISAG